MPDVWSVAAIAAKFLMYLGILGSTGLVLARIVFGQATAGLWDGISRQAFALALLGLLASGLDFALKGAVLTGDAAGMTDPQMLGLLWRTPAGTAVVYRGTGLLLLLAGLPVPGIGVWISAAGGVLTLWSFSRIGHVPEAGPFWLEMLLLLHLMGIAFWIGALFPLRRLAGEPGSLSEAAMLGHRFGQIAVVVVPVLLIAGIVMAWYLLGKLSALINTGYGLTLLAKIVVVLVLLGAATVNKLRFVPAMRNGDRFAAALLRRSIAIEWTAVYVILLITAALTSVPDLPS